MRNADRARFANVSVKNCRVFGAENFKTRRRNRGNSVSKYFLRSFEGSARRDEDERLLQMQFLGMRNAERAQSTTFARKIAMFSAPKIEKTDAANGKN